MTRGRDTVARPPRGWVPCCILLATVLWAVGCESAPDSSSDAALDGGAAVDVAPLDDAGPADGHTDAAPDPDKAPTLTGRLITPDGDAVIGLTTLACGDFDCRYAVTDAQGVFRHDNLDLEPRRFEVLGQVEKFGSVVLRREFTPGLQLDLGDVVLPQLEGAKAAWEPEPGGVAVLLDGDMTLEAAPDTIKYFPGTLEYAVQAAPLAIEHVPDFYNKPWVGAEDDSIALSLAPFDVFTTEPVLLRLRDDRLHAAGAVYEMFHVDPLVGTLEPAGTATVSADGWLVSDPDSELTDLTFMMFVPVE